MKSDTNLKVEELETKRNFLKAEVQTLKNNKPNHEYELLRRALEEPKAVVFSNKLHI